MLLLRYSDIRQVYFKGPGNEVIYPNPASDKIYLTIKDWSVIKEIRLTDVNGKIIKRQDKAIQGIILNVPPGIYFVQLIRTNGTLSSYKIEKK